VTRPRPGHADLAGVLKYDRLDARDILERASVDLLLDELHVLDAHGHLGPSPNFPLCWPEPGAIVRTMDLLRIDTTFVSPLAGMVDEARGDRQLQTALADFPGRLSPVPIANPNRLEAALELLERWRRVGGVRMVKVHPTIHAYPVDGEAYEPIFEFAGEAGWLVLSHTWGGDPHCDPARFDAVARAHPSTRFLLGHAGGTTSGIRTAVDMTLRYDNLLVDLAGSLVFDGALEWMVSKVGVERVLF
jgi:predicted TIM-barrel fold metal-dependent hydrolase